MFLHSKICCCVKYWDHWSNNIFTECVGGSRSQWSTGCRPLIFANLKTVALMEVKCCFWGNFYWPFFFRFFCWFCDGCVGRATPSKIRHSLYTKPSALSTCWEILPFPTLFLIIWREKRSDIFMSFPWVVFQTSALTLAIQISICFMCLNKPASWINHVVKDLVWTWDPIFGERISAFSSCCKN